MSRLSDGRRNLWRAVALGVLVLVLSPLSFSPLGPLTLISVPAAISFLIFFDRRPVSVLLACGLLGMTALGFRDPSELWYLERGWALLIAGGFVVAQMLEPVRTIFSKSIVGVLLAVATVVIVGWVRPDLLVNVDWLISGKFDQILAMFDLEGQTGAGVAEAMRQVMRVVNFIYPAMLILASVAALGCASYVTGRMAGIEAPLGSMREFSFSDHLVWAFVLGLVLSVLPAGVWAARAGGNMVTVMGGLYVFRGAAVLVCLGKFFTSSGWLFALWIIAALLLYPFTIGTAFLMGLSDTWLDFRSRLKIAVEQ
jgi:hypothetical protein